MDILIAIVPKIDPDAPTIGPALLKTHVEDAGFSCEIIDLNIKLFRAAQKEKMEHVWQQDDHFFSTDWTDPYLSDDFNDFYNKFKYVFDEWIELFKQKNPKYLGLSLLSIYSQSVAIKIGQLVKEHLPHIKIIWGGPQVEYGIDKFVELGYLDHYIFGDAELSLVEFLKGNLDYIGIDDVETINQLQDLDSMKFPNYDDIDWTEYHDPYNESATYITGSRGCVKRCTFCNVYKIWPDFRFRSGENIANEMIYIKERYDRNLFKFTDSLINGSMKAFRNLCNVLADYKKEKDSELSWISQWVIRSKSQSPESDYIAMKESGCIRLEIGLESFSEDVRWHMGKKFTDEDMWWCLEMLNKHKIKHVLLMIVGYPTETEEHHEHTLKCIRKVYENGWHEYTKFSFGNTLMLSRPMPLFKLIEKDLEYFNSNIDWKYKDNDLETRVRRFKEVNELVDKLSNEGLPWMSVKSLQNYEKKLEGSLPNNRWDG